MINKLTGIGTALITPFLENNNIDYLALKNIINFVSKGSDYIVVNGTTGESATTTKAEKETLLKFVSENNSKNLPIVFGIGGNNTSEVLATINETNFENIDALLSVCPYYVKPTQRGIIAHFTSIADASPVPVILYNVPGRTVTSISVETVLELSKHPNICALKDATSSMEIALELAKVLPKDFLLLSGDDNLVTPQISVGYKGVISVISNGFPEEFHKMVHAALKGDFKTAASIQYKFLEFDNLLYLEGNPVGIKKVCEIRELCHSRVRLPLLQASDSLGNSIKQAMVSNGFL